MFPTITSTIATTIMAPPIAATRVLLKMAQLKMEYIAITPANTNIKRLPTTRQIIVVIEVE